MILQDLDSLLGLFRILITYLGFVAIILIAIAVGFRLGKYRSHRNGNKDKVSISSVNSAMLALFGFILAFTFSLTSNRHTVRRQLLLADTNSIGTAFLRTDLLPEPARTQSRDLFKEYVDIRVDVNTNGNQNPEIVVPAILRSEEIQQELWALAATEDSRNVESEWLKRLFYLDSLNDVIDIHAERVAVGLYTQIPRSVWFILYFMLIQTMLAVGYEFGMAGKVSILASLLLALMFSSVLLLIKDLDRNIGRVLIRTNNRPLLELQKQIDSSLD